MIQLREFFPKEMQQCSNEPKPLRHERFDIFKGQRAGSGEIIKIRSVGAARLTEGYRTYIIQLKSLLDDTFYLLPERKDGPGRADFAVLTREHSSLPGRRFFWNKVGEGIMLPPPNMGILHLFFDLFGADDLYVNMTPLAEVQSAVAEATGTM